ncbi:MAG: O-antigen ligase family protein [Opitutales bacterium]
MTDLANSDRVADPRPTAAEGRLELAVLGHLSVLSIGAAWAFGGNSPGARTLIGCWATLGFVLHFLLVRHVRQRRDCLPRSLVCLWPLLGFNLLVLVSLFFPSYRPVGDFSETFYVPIPAPAFLPSSARPGLSLYALWIFDGIYLSCFNLLLAIRSRHAFRLLLLALATNALVLAVFGTLQKLVRAKGLFFGLQASPQPKFFASFVYSNHWGAFAVLMITLGLGLFFHFFRRHAGQDLLHTPAPLVLTSVAFLAMSVPLSGSRSCSLLTLLVLTLALLHWCAILLKRRRDHRVSSRYPLLGALVVFALIASAAYYLGEPVIRRRLADTQEQLAAMRASDSFGGRKILYADTWRMGRERWLFGWGLASYPTVFYRFNSQQESPLDHLPNYYYDAHSDWLQSFAESGVCGTALLVLCGLAPLYYCRQTLARSPLSSYLLAGNGLLLLYALLEFPFGNTAVVIAFWLTFFTALQYGRIEADRPA